MSAVGILSLPLPGTYRKEKRASPDLLKKKYVENGGGGRLRRLCIGSNIDGGSARTKRFQGDKSECLHRSPKKTALKVLTRGEDCYLKKRENRRERDR